MIRHGIVDGQDAILSYIDNQFQPVPKNRATLLVAILEDGRKLFLKVPPSARTADFNPLHEPAGSSKGGEFAHRPGGTIEAFRPSDSDPSKPWPNEDDGNAGLGDEILVFRLGSAKGGLAGKNGGNVNGVAVHLGNVEDFEKPQAMTGSGDTITSYRVKLLADPGDYGAVIGGKGAYGTKQEELGHVGRSTYRNGDYVQTKYSFPADGAGYQHERLDSVPLTAVKEQLKAMGHQHIGEAGTLSIATAIRTAFNERLRRARKGRVVDFNPLHEPKGSSKGGQFAKKRGGTPSGIEAYYKRAEQEEAALKHSGAEPTNFTIADFEKAGMIEGDGIRREEEFLDLWNRLIRMSPEDFKWEMLGGIGNQMKIDYLASEKQLRWGGSLIDDEGAPMGTYAASMALAEKKAKIDYLELETAKQGKGTGKDIVRHTIDQFEKFGMESVGLHANIDVGGYAWAKYGFVPTGYDWKGTSADEPGLRKEIGNRAAKLYMENKISGDEMKALHKMFTSDDPRAIYAVADSPVGKQLLLDTSWYGSINLNSSETMRRFNAYVGRKR